MTYDIKEFCAPVESMIEEFVRSTAALRGWFYISLNDLAAELYPIIAATIWAPLFSGQPGSIHLTYLIRCVLEDRFTTGQIVCSGETVYFFHDAAPPASDTLIAQYQREFLAGLETGERETPEELLPDSERFIAKLAPGERGQIDPRFVAYLIKTGIDLNYMTPEDFDAVEPDCEG